MSIEKLGHDSPKRELNKNIAPEKLVAEQKELYERYKDLIPDIELQSEKQIEEFKKYSSQEIYDSVGIDAYKLKFLIDRFKKDGLDIRSSEALQRKFLIAGQVTPVENYYVDDSEIFLNSKEALIHRAIISNQTKERFKADLIVGVNLGNPALNKLEALSYLGVTPETLEDIKSAVLDSGDMILIEKLCENFSISLTRENYVTLAEKAYGNESAYDLARIVNKIPDIDKKYLEKRDSLIEAAKNNFTINKQKIIDGLSNKDFLTHFSKIENLRLILEHGILSIRDQKEILGEIKSGEGPDLQEIFGRRDCISVFDLYKGSTGEEESVDRRIYQELRKKVLDLMYDFQKSYPERVFSFINPVDRDNKGKPLKEISHNYLTKEERVTKYKNFSKCIYESSYLKQYIDPFDVEDPLSRTVLVQSMAREEERFYLVKEYIESKDDMLFGDLFFENLDDRKKELLNKIKILMREAKEESLLGKKTDTSILESLDLQSPLGGYYDRGQKVVFIVDPNLSRTFVKSMYDKESFVEDRITPDKILGLKLTDDRYIQKECFNLGKVAVRLTKKAENNGTDTVLIDDGFLVVYIEDLYKN